MKVKALRNLLHDELGPINKGQEFEATEAQLSGVARFVEVYKTKVIHEVPENAISDTNSDKAALKTGPNGRKRGRLSHAAK